MEYVDADGGRWRNPHSRRPFRQQCSSFRIVPQRTLFDDDLSLTLGKLWSSSKVNLIIVVCMEQQHFIGMYIHKNYFLFCSNGHKILFTTYVIMCLPGTPKESLYAYRFGRRLLDQPTDNSRVFKHFISQL